MDLSLVESHCHRMKSTFRGDVLHLSLSPSAPLLRVSQTTLRNPLRGVLLSPRRLGRRLKLFTRGTAGHEGRRGNDKKICPIIDHPSRLKKQWNVHRSNLTARYYLRRSSVALWSTTWLWIGSKERCVNQWVTQMWFILDVLKWFPFLSTFNPVQCPLIKRRYQSRQSPFIHWWSFLFVLNKA